MNSQVARIRSKLSSFQPGRWWRRERLRVAPQAEVVAWEQYHEISLPEAYRTFLIEVANGAAGSCELYSLSQWWWHLVDSDDSEVRRLWPSRPCLLREELENEKDWLEHIGGSKNREDPEFKTWSPWAGTIALSDEGCGTLAVLIMTGNLRGRVCHNDFPNAPVFSPQANFLDWYEARLDGAPW